MFHASPRKGADIFSSCLLQLLGSLYPQMEGRKGQTALEHFKTAAEKNTNSGQVLEILGELLARTDPQGGFFLQGGCSSLGIIKIVLPECGSLSGLGHVTFYLLCL